MIAQIFISCFIEIFTCSILCHFTCILLLYESCMYSAVPLYHYVWGLFEWTMLKVNCVIKGQFYKGILGKFYGHFPIIPL